ncbi:hypothetical protein NEOLEDRAFT_1240395 [Neolentinus lepideus HHB14362 ss-1]|uniref:BTB domain-containing protein n=1 Tax=Neolentinus lepideus HHB14362 ss-1 TaxID=1314782 RepID=A0A165U0M3_9AGAM|nr:hypothetical protein NEOLEDRAFT_1240395 [Neolentinus lepideus HHB14362 ss-1]
MSNAQLDPDSTPSTGKLQINSVSSTGDGSSSVQPPRKRARVDGHDYADSAAEGGLTASDVIRDERYYMADGSCVLLVEKTLFNVHKSMLSRDSSSFATMFDLPQGEGPIEGTSDDHPILLAGDTVDEFRNFLWAMYALPLELMVVHTAHANLGKLMDIARVSNKYSFKSLETWALDAIQAYVNRQPSPALLKPIALLNPHDPAHHTPTFRLSSGRISNLIRLAHLCNHEKLLGTMVDLLKRLMGCSVPYAYLAMCLADELNLRELKGAAYLEVMQKTEVVAREHVEIPIIATPDARDGEHDEDVPETMLAPDGRLVVSFLQKHRLRCGYYGLSQAWEHMRLHPPQFDHAPSCGATWHQHGCTQSWMEFWKEKTRGEGVLALGLADVLGRLRAIAKEFDKWGSATYMHHDCRLNAKRLIQEKLKQVEDDLPDYFSEERKMM